MELIFAFVSCPKGRATHLFVPTTHAPEMPRGAFFERAFGGSLSRAPFPRVRPTRAGASQRGYLCSAGVICIIAFDLSVATKTG
ncbi:MAG TPA: hypothetical protein VK388_01685 [Pyrinomonadaceae bacterium]|nr:hypothetical protein [Pyrinomonadaceae bacterium]